MFVNSSRLLPGSFPGLSQLYLCSICRRRIAGLANESSPSARLKNAFQTLGLVKDECSVDDIRKAYIDLAKKYHPDSRSSQANTDHFIMIRNAYKQCISYAKNVSLTRKIHAALEEELQDMDKSLGFRVQKKKVAHRQFLNYDGVGPGTYSEREKAYRQLRLDQARDNVFDKKFQDALRNEDAKEVRPYSGDPWPKSTKVTNSFERIANEMIRDSIKKGEFSNLAGQGKPMERSWENPALDNMEQKITAMLGNSGFTPDWVMLDREIKTRIMELKDQIAVIWNQCGPHPMSLSKTVEWEHNLSILQEQVKDINKKIRDRNLKGPLPGQRVHLKLHNLVAQVTSSVIPANRSAEPEAKESRVARDIETSSFIQLTGFFIAICAFISLFRL